MAIAGFVPPRAESSRSRPIVAAVRGKLVIAFTPSELVGGPDVLDDYWGCIPRTDDREVSDVRERAPE